jgi:hypothetical protein
MIIILKKCPFFLLSPAFSFFAGVLLNPLGFHFDAHICYKEKWEHPDPCLNIKSQDTQLKIKNQTGYELFF